MITGMIRSRQKKEKERFYLLPGQGGKAMRRKHRVFLVWSIGAGLLVSLALAASMYYINMRKF